MAERRRIRLPRSGFVHLQHSQVFSHLIKSVISSIVGLSDWVVTAICYLHDKVLVIALNAIKWSRRIRSGASPSFAIRGHELP